MGNYYYLASSLPLLEFPVLPEDISSASIRESLEMNLSKEDWKRVQSLYVFVDLSNIKPLFGEEEIDHRGNLDEKALEDALLHQTFFPIYVFDFLQKYETREERLKNFPAILSQFFREETEKEKGFLQKYFSFERELRLVLLAIRAKKLNRDLLKELQFEDVTDSFVLHILSQKDADQYDPPMEYKEVKELLDLHGSDPLEQNKAIAGYRFRKINEMEEDKPFSIDFLLAYLAQLMILEYWSGLSEDQGKVILSTFKKSEQ
jgi:transposase